MTRARDIKRIRQALQRRRRDLLSAHNGAKRELRALKDQERDPEFEEGAQAELADYTLSSLLENQQRELSQIDAALARIDEGTYGECVDCGEPIVIERLMALPFALRCALDAHQEESTRPGGRPAAPSM